MHHLYKEKTAKGRYVTLSHLEKRWLSLMDFRDVDVIGKSENEKNIYSITKGKGEKKCSCGHRCTEMNLQPLRQFWTWLIF